MSHTPHLNDLVPHTLSDLAPPAILIPRANYFNQGLSASRDIGNVVTHRMHTGIRDGIVIRVGFFLHFAS